MLVNKMNVRSQSQSYHNRNEIWSTNQRIYMLYCEFIVKLASFTCTPQLYIFLLFWCRFHFYFLYPHVVKFSSDFISLSRECFHIHKLNFSFSYALVNTLFMAGSAKYNNDRKFIWFITNSCVIIFWAYKHRQINIFNITKHERQDFIILFNNFHKFRFIFKSIK